ncbi:type II toxin-antitoxin system VapC family toxin [Syntrophothermus lipocalidus]|uniref:Ribonuclease VapC n=1 Tax=Syntrophothermus lipocalidus (strain DSM 12680 / TGB-C1) TaxID=643648 RepID=D7CIZ9_SYNLT|nr:PIN domain nuclease [Syntrophothermus lipocalidus]ADI02877.1 PilT protein domain protein [Syntrophothermus lipocalidus DSM 12680]HOV43069.1 PIN domain nuclease [Syntrophothermus lipocalidus]
MSERFLVDTSVWIEALRPRGKPEVASWLREALIRDAVVLIPLVKEEILMGARDEKQFSELEEMLGALPLLKEKPEIWERVASIGFSLRRQGLRIPTLDLLIICWALTYECTLAHRDHHFTLAAERIPGLKTVTLLSS